MLAVQSQAGLSCVQMEGRTANWSGWQGPLCMGCVWDPEPTEAGLSLKESCLTCVYQTSNISHKRKGGCLLLPLLHELVGRQGHAAHRQC